MAGTLTIRTDYSTSEFWRLAAGSKDAKISESAAVVSCGGPGRHEPCNYRRPSSAPRQDLRSRARRENSKPGGAKPDTKGISARSATIPTPLKTTSPRTVRAAGWLSTRTPRGS